MIMKDTKLKERFENAFEAFFNDEIIERHSMVVAGDKSLSQQFQNSELSEKADKVYGFFKKVFLFLPGVLIMHFASISFALFFGYEGVNLSLRVFWIAAAIFMIWAGIGDLRNKKHLLIPLPPLVLGLAIGTSLNYLGLGFFSYVFLLLPLFFITPILTKDAIDVWSENKNHLTNSETIL
jgi:hypothetical protein